MKHYVYLASLNITKLKIK